MSVTTPWTDPPTGWRSSDQIDLDVAIACAGHDRRLPSSEVLLLAAGDFEFLTERQEIEVITPLGVGLRTFERIGIGLAEANAHAEFASGLPL